MPDLSMRNISKNIIEILRTVVLDEKKDKFVIYTNGMGGKFAKEYLETEFGIKPEYIIDNKKYDGINVLSIEQALERNNEGVYFLICSWHGEYYTEIRKKIYRAFPKEQIIDLFPIKENKPLPTDEEICKVIQSLDTYIKNVEK